MVDTCVALLCPMVSDKSTHVNRFSGGVWCGAAWTVSIGGQVRCIVPELTPSPRLFFFLRLEIAACRGGLRGMHKLRCNITLLFRSCVKVEVAVMGSLP